MDSQDTPNSNNERRLPNVLILNTRSLVSKTDELANLVELYKSNLVFVQWRNGRVSGCPVTGGPRTLGAPDKKEHKKFDSTFLGN